MASIDDDDFRYQLEQEALAAAAAAAASNNPEGSENSANIRRDPDGTIYEWDKQLNGWFPRLTEDLIVNYQATYGGDEKQDDDDVNDGGGGGGSTTHNKNSTPESSDTNDQMKNQPLPKPSSLEHLTGKNVDQSHHAPGGLAEASARKRGAPPEPPKWFEMDDAHNTNVYVSNLPLDITDEEFITLMKKCGLIMKDDRNQLKIKLYRDSLGMPKGDGRCCYIKVESVDLALQILDGYEHRGHVIHVERAKFELKGDYDPSKKPKKRKKNKKDKEKERQRVEKLFDWRPDKLRGERAKHEKTVVIKNFFDPAQFERDPRAILEYRADLSEECEEKCGPVHKVQIYDLNPEGVATVTFKEFEHADACVELMNGRFFAGKRLEAKLWDGKTKYRVVETEEEAEKRTAKWYNYLEGDATDNASAEKNS